MIDLAEGLAYRRQSGLSRATSSRGLGVGLVGVIAGLAVLLGSTPPAHAATPILLGAGNRPAVAVNGAGTAFIAYLDNDDDPTTSAPDAVVHYCRLPRGATVCDHRLDFALEGTTLTRPHVFVEGQTVRILAFRYGRSGPSFAANYVLSSTDGGEHRHGSGRAQGLGWEHDIEYAGEDYARGGRPVTPVVGGLA